MVKGDQKTETKIKVIIHIYIYENETETNWDNLENVTKGMTR